MRYVYFSSADDTDGADSFFILYLRNKKSALSASSADEKFQKTLYFYPFCFALYASAYIRICFTMESNPLLRVGERCSFRPIWSMK